MICRFSDTWPKSPIKIGCKPDFSGIRIAAKSSMARKMNASKPCRDVRGQAEVTNHRLVPQVAPYLIPPPPHTLKITSPKRRIQLAIEVEMRAEIPGPVKIIHTV
jgi:hypothetical protein